MFGLPLLQNAIFKLITISLSSNQEVLSRCLDRLSYKICQSIFGALQGNLYLESKKKSMAKTKRCFWKQTPCILFLLVRNSEILKSSLYFFLLDSWVQMTTILPLPEVLWEITTLIYRDLYLHSINYWDLICNEELTNQWGVDIDKW